MQKHGKFCSKTFSITNICLRCKTNKKKRKTDLLKRVRIWQQIALCARMFGIRNLYVLDLWLWIMYILVQFLLLFFGLHKKKLASGTTENWLKLTRVHCIFEAFGDSWQQGSLLRCKFIMVSSDTSRWYNPMNRNLPLAPAHLHIVVEVSISAAMFTCRHSL